MGGITKRRACPAVKTRARSVKTYRQKWNEKRREHTNILLLRSPEEHDRKGGRPKKRAGESAPLSIHFLEEALQHGSREPERGNLPKKERE